MRRGLPLLAILVVAAGVALVACGGKEPADGSASVEAPASSPAHEPSAGDAGPAGTGAPTSGTEPGAIATAPVAPLSGIADRVVVEVNGQPIRAKRILGAVEMNRLRALSMGHTMTPEEGAALRAAALNSFVTDELLFQAAKQEGIVASAPDIAEEVRSLRSGFPTTEQYREFLQRAGMEEDSVEDDAARRVTVRAYVKKLAGNIAIPESDARSFYEANQEKFATPEQVRASIIVVLSKPNDSESLRAEARKRIEEAHKKAVAGEDFASLARQFSQIPNAASGGDLGTFGRDDGLPPKLEDIAFSTAPGEISPVFETTGGLCIVKTMAKTPAGTRSFDEVKRLITEELARQKEGAAVEAKLEDLRKTATIEVKEPDFLPQSDAAIAGPSVPQPKSR